MASGSTSRHQSRNSDRRNEDIRKIKPRLIDHSSAKERNSHPSTEKLRRKRSRERTPTDAGNRDSSRRSHRPPSSEEPFKRRKREDEAKDHRSCYTNRRNKDEHGIVERKSRASATEQPSSSSQKSGSSHSLVRTTSPREQERSRDKAQSSDAVSDASGAPISSKLATAVTPLGNTRFLDLEALGKRSEQRLRQEKLVYLPDSNSYYFEKQKEQYYANMYRLIVTARRQIQQLEETIDVLHKRIDSSSIVSCPSCKHNFSSGEHRFLPRYLKVLQSTSRVELQFNDSEHLKNWLIASNLDRDAKGIPCLIKEIRPVDKCTLAQVGSTLVAKKV